MGRGSNQNWSLRLSTRCGISHLSHLLMPDLPSMIAGSRHEWCPPSDLDDRSVE